MQMASSISIWQGVDYFIIDPQSNIDQDPARQGNFTFVWF